MFKVNNKDTRTTPWPRSGVYIVNFEDVIAGWVIYNLHIKRYPDFQGD